MSDTSWQVPVKPIDGDTAVVVEAADHVDEMLPESRVMQDGDARTWLPVAQMLDEESIKLLAKWIV